MPMIKGHSAQVVSQNVKEMVRSGMKPKMAIAASLASARRSKKMAAGGMVQDVEQGGMGDLNPLLKDEFSKGGDSVSMGEMDRKDPEDYMRGLNEIREEGEYYPNEVANPNEMSEAQGFAGAIQRQLMAKKSPENFAKGGLVQTGPKEDQRLHGAQPEEDMKDGAEDMSAMPRKPSGMGLSAEAMEALMKKKKARRFE